MTDRGGTGRERGERGEAAEAQTKNGSHPEGAVAPKNGPTARSRLAHGGAVVAAGARARRVISAGPHLIREALSSKREHVPNFGRSAVWGSENERCSKNRRI